MSKNFKKLPGLQSVIYALVLVLFVSLLSSCGGGKSNPATPSGYGEINISVDLSGASQKNKKNLLPTISKVVASVSASDLDTQTKNLTSGGNGIWTGTMQVRVGKSRTFTVEAYETNNIVVYRNCGPVVVDIVEGTNTVKVQLCDVSGSISISGKTIYNLVWNIDSSGYPNVNNVATALAVDSSNIYFVEEGSTANYANATLKKIPAASGTITTLATGLNFVTTLETDGTEVFWTEYGSSTVKKVSVNGGSVTTLASGLSFPHTLALDSSNVYWSEYNGGTIKKIAKTGGAITTLASGLSFPNHLATDGTDVFWAEGTNGEIIKKVSVGGGSVTTVSTGSINRTNFQLTATNIYFVEGIAPFSIKTVPKSGGTVTTLVTGIVQIPDRGAIRLDATDIYFLDTGGSPSYSGVLKKVPIGGGTVTDLTTPCPLNRPFALYADSTNLYWIDLGTSTNTYTDGVLRKMAK